MPKFFISWEVEASALPASPEERMKLLASMTQWTIADMKAGIFKDWGRRSGEMGGFAISNDIDEVKLDQALLKYTPYVKFQANPVLSAEQNLEGLKKLAEEMKKM